MLQPIGGKKKSEERRREREKRKKRKERNREVGKGERGEWEMWKMQMDFKIGQVNFSRNQGYRPAKNTLLRSRFYKFPA